MRYLFGFVCVLAWACVGCELDEGTQCLIVRDCGAYRCPDGQEVFCGSEHVCSCRTPGGTGGTGGTAGAGGVGGGGPGGTGGSADCNGGVVRREPTPLEVECTPPDAGKCIACNAVCLENGFSLGSLGEQCVDEPPFNTFGPVCVCDCAYCQPL